MEKYSECISVLISVLTAMSIFMPFVIQWLKKLVTEETIVKKFKTVELFSFICTAIVALVIYVFVLVFVPTLFSGWSIPQIILMAIGFIAVAGFASQGMYDKVIKQLLTWFSKS